MTRNGSVFPLPPSVRRIPGSVSSSSPTALFRTPLASDAARGGETLQQVQARRGTIALSHQIIDLTCCACRGVPVMASRSATMPGGVGRIWFVVVGGVRLTMNY